MKKANWGKAALSCVAIVLALAIHLQGIAHAQSSTPSPDLWVTNGPVYAIARTPDTIYLGGDFTAVGPYSGQGVPIDTATGTPVPTFPKVNGTVFATVADGVGGWYIGGQFTLVGCVARNNIAHILSDGTVDPTFNPNANNIVYALAVSGGTVYAGGEFLVVGGQVRGRIAALDASTGLATAWNPNANFNVLALAVSGSTVYAGGVFTNIGGQARNRIAALDASTGLATAWDPNASVFSVRALAVSSGTVYAGGDFSNIGGQARNNIAALDASTGLATTWNPNADNTVAALTVSGGTVYAGGGFVSIGGQARRRIAALDASTGLATTWDPNADNIVFTLTVSGSTVYAGGDFTTIGGQARNRIAALDASTGLATTWNPNASNTVRALAISGGTVYAGGQFTSLGGQARNRIAALDASTGLATTWNPNASNTVQALAISGSTVYAGGVFTTIGGQARNRIAALDATTGLATAWNPNATGGVNALSVSGGAVYAGGVFTTIGGQARNRIAALDASTGLATTWDPNADNIVFTLTVSGSTVYAGGLFTNIGGQARNRIAALDASTGLATTWDPNASERVFTLTVSGSTVYAGGAFFSIGGQARPSIAALDASTGLATAWNPNADNTVYELTVSGGTVYAGGSFTNIGGQARNNIAALDASTGLATAWNPNANNTVFDLAVSGGAVYAGGAFTSIGSCANAAHIAMFLPDPGITVAPTSGLVTTEAGGTETFTVVLNSRPTADVTVALTGSQVTPTPSPLTFTSGNWNQVQTVTVTAIDDAIDETSPHSGSVSFAVTSGDSNYNAFPIASVSVSISDNDTAGVTISESAGTTAVTEGGAADTYTAVLTSEPVVDVTITPSTTGEVSFSPTSRTFTAANWNLPQSFAVSAIDDNVVEDAENATITHASTSGDPNYQGAPVASVSVVITDNDSAVVAFNPVSVSQAEATSPMTFTVTLSNPVQSGVTLAVNTTTGTATAADFTPVGGGTVTFAPNTNTSQTVNVVINNDDLDENDETFEVMLSSMTAIGNVTLAPVNAVGTILDDDATPTLSITSPSQLEGDVGDTAMTFTVGLSVISGRDVTFTRATADGTATVGDSDYLALAPAVLTIPAGDPDVEITVQIVGDTTSEGNEDFRLDLTSIVNATPASLTGTGTIEDDDQQPTVTTITSDLPDPSVVGQPYTVAVNVAAVTNSPLGMVTISDGSASCGPVTLTPTTPPNSTASCALTSTTAGARTLTASYTAAGMAFADSSGTTTHQIDAAATTVSVSGPPRSRINQPTVFAFALSVNAPGAGTPAGTVTLSSGASSCNVTVPTATPSCALTFTALGSRTVSAAFVPSDGNFLGSSSSGSGDAQTLVYALSDIAVTKDNGVTAYRPGDLLVYTVTVRNLGADAAAQIRVRDNLPAGLTDVVWSCDSSGGVACPQAGGSGNIDALVTSFPVGGLLNYTISGNVIGAAPQIANTAFVELPADMTIEDPEPGNNSATDTDLLDFLLRDGFETVAINAPSGSQRLPASLLGRVTGGEVAQIGLVLDDAQGAAVRVYAREFDGQVQVALATRAGNGALRLAPWQSAGSDPEVVWTARQVAGGWVLVNVQLR